MDMPQTRGTLFKIKEWGENRPRQPILRWIRSTWNPTQLRVTLRLIIRETLITSQSKITFTIIIIMTHCLGIMRGNRLVISQGRALKIIWFKVVRSKDNITPDQALVLILDNPTVLGARKRTRVPYLSEVNLKIWIIERVWVCRSRWSRNNLKMMILISSQQIERTTTTKMISDQWGTLLNIQPKRETMLWTLLGNQTGPSPKLLRARFQKINSKLLQRAIERNLLLIKIRMQESSHHPTSLSLKPELTDTSTQVSRTREVL